MSLILSETRERLLKAIIAQVPPERIAEIHFFAPIKQGGVESGVAVIAAVPETVPVVEDAAGIDEGAEAQEVSEVAPEPEQIADEASEDSSEVAAEAADEMAEAAEEEAAAETADEIVDESAEAPADAVVDAAVGDEDVGTPAVPAPDTSSKRHVIYTARYRYTLKGPDRGKWETNVKAEADAPLITVETVVRGVQRRVGDNDEPERVTGDEIRTVTNAWAAALPGTAPASR